MPNVASGRAQHLAIVLRLGTSHTRTIYGARASAWRHNLNGKEGGCRGCSHPAQRGVGWGEPRRAPAPTGHSRMLWLDACPRHTPGHSHQRGTERWAMAEGADHRGGGNGRTTGTQPLLPRRGKTPSFPDRPHGTSAPCCGCAAEGRGSPGAGCEGGAECPRPPTPDCSAPAGHSHPPLSPPAVPAAPGATPGLPLLPAKGGGGRQAPVGPPRLRRAAGAAPAPRHAGGATGGGSGTPARPGAPGGGCLGEPDSSRCPPWVSGGGGALPPVPTTPSRPHREPPSPARQRGHGDTNRPGGCPPPAAVIPAFTGRARGTGGTGGTGTRGPAAPPARGRREGTGTGGPAIPVSPAAPSASFSAIPAVSPPRPSRRRPPPRAAPGTSPPHLPVRVPAPPPALTAGWSCSSARRAGCPGPPAAPGPVAAAAAGAGAGAQPPSCRRPSPPRSRGMEGEPSPSRPRPAAPAPSSAPRAPAAAAPPRALPPPPRARPPRHRLGTGTRLGLRVPAGADTRVGSREDQVPPESHQDLHGWGHLCKVLLTLGSHWDPCGWIHM